MKPGKIIEISGETVGEHKGVLYYTIGQRKGLNIGGTGPYYVIGKDVAKNELYVANTADESWLYSSSCIVRDMNYLADITFPMQVNAKFRYRQEDQPVTIERIDDNTLNVVYPQGIRSVTPGQEAVFYDGDVMLGGGVIDTVYQNGEDVAQKIRNKLEVTHGI